MTHVWIYYNTNKQMGDVDHLKVFATGEAADRWLAEHDPEGVVWRYPVEPAITSSTSQPPP